MKVFFDTNVYIAEALLGGATQRVLAATQKASWKIYCSSYVLDELERVLCERLIASRRFARLSRIRTARRSVLVNPTTSRHKVPDDPADSPILNAALYAGVDYLVTNDDDLLDLNPYEGLEILSVGAYYNLLLREGILK